MTRSLKALELHLPQFWRIHKGYLVNPVFIDKQSLPTRLRPLIQLKTGERLPVLRRRIGQVADQMKALA